MSTICWQSVFDMVVKDIPLVTHCHSCGVEFPVCLRGYGGEHCSKACWRENEEALYLLQDSVACTWGGCKLCMSGGFCRISLANSSYRRAGTVYWPMGDPRRPCLNECIKTKKPICTK